MFLTVVMREPVLPRAALGIGELRAAGAQWSPLHFPNGDPAWWHLMAPQAGFQRGQEPILAQIGCCSERGRVASGQRDHSGLGVTPCFPVKLW